MTRNEVVTLRVILETDHPEQGQVFGTWAEQVGLKTDRLKNDGCGCCVDIYTFSAILEAAAELDQMLRAVNTGVEYLTDPA